ncbi:MAG: hypothetical protein KDB37_07785 [Ilumatobacter sp.]|nr:hypothetical protein [Ilumatobacter sp.]
MLPGYQLSLAGAVPITDEHHDAGTAGGAVWKDAGTETYLVLTVRPGLAAGQPSPTGLGPMRQLDEFPSELGQAWITRLDTDEPRSPLQLRMWWSRPDGDVWLLSSYWYGPDDFIDPDAATNATTTWATHITEISDDPDRYELEDTVADSNMELVFAQPAGEIRSRAQIWRVDGVDVTVLTTESAAASGFNNLLAAGPPTTTVVGGQPAWIVEADDGSTIAGWRGDETARAWTTITIPAELVDRAGEILDSLSVDVDRSADPGGSQQPSTTMVSPPTTIDPEVLAATWPASGNWLIYTPAAQTATSDPVGFAVLAVQPNGDRFVSLGHGQCFTHSGRAVDTNGLTELEPIADAVEAPIECDPGQPSAAFIDTVDCLEDGCILDLDGDEIALLRSTGQTVARLARTNQDVP